MCWTDTPWSTQRGLLRSLRSAVLHHIPQNGGPSRRISRRFCGRGSESPIWLPSGQLPLFYFENFLKDLEAFVRPAALKSMPTHPEEEEVEGDETCQCAPIYAGTLAATFRRLRPASPVHAARRKQRAQARVRSEQRGAPVRIEGCARPVRGTARTGADASDGGNGELRRVVCHFAATQGDSIAILNSRV
ncbi:hypothetical protein V5799_030492 [Amblyomma americanum]|uniref:Uncharacterized protein n=1 Tax=Amblyomma americanum TaxID=6943 RepID=A0AAQ4ENV8_AMBAM